MALHASIDYHLSRRTSGHADDVLYVRQSTCQADRRSVHDLRDAQVAARLLKDCEQDMRDSDEITCDRWKRRPLWEKIVGPSVWILERQQ